ncbi:MAG: hypothetical protein CBC42_04210 [Betaproteobacteria bacterium TMED82]|nr:MAG: hypothetical protein CBC42_04210 [Betaproteobacteria bacterium TMED82]
MLTNLAAILVFLPMEAAPQLLWCTKQADNAHINFCFEKKIECKTFSELKNGKVRKSKKSICLPTRV